MVSLAGWGIDAASTPLLCDVATVQDRHMGDVSLVEALRGVVSVWSEKVDLSRCREVERPTRGLQQGTRVAGAYYDAPTSQLNR